MSITHALEKALSAFRYEQPMHKEARRLARVADAELLLVLKKLDQRVDALEKGEGR